jgi:arsenite methyltransferase
MTIDCAFDWSRISSVVGPYLRPGGPTLTRRALKACDLAPGSCVADIGCGTGGTLKSLEKTGLHNLTGIDSSETLLAQAAGYLESAQLIRGNAEKLPLKADILDALFCECVLSILDDRKTALGGFAKAIKEGGFLVMSDVFRQDDSGQEKSTGEPEKPATDGLFSKEELVGLLKEFSLSLVLWEEHERELKEFAARLILAGECLPLDWGCVQGQRGKKINRLQVSYFLLVARKRERQLFSESGIRETKNYE